MIYKKGRLFVALLFLSCVLLLMSACRIGPEPSITVENPVCTASFTQPYECTFEIKAPSYEEGEDPMKPFPFEVVVSDPQNMEVLPEKKATLQFNEGVAIQVIIHRCITMVKIEVFDGQQKDQPPIWSTNAQGPPCDKP